jgi:hypothetical protein
MTTALLLLLKAKAMKLCLKHCARKKYSEVETKHHALFISVLFGD